MTFKTRHYVVSLINRSRNIKTSYLADSFSVSDNRVLKLYSEEYGNVFVKIKNDEELIVNEIVLK